MVSHKFLNTKYGSRSKSCFFFLYINIYFFPHKASFKKGKTTHPLLPLLNINQTMLLNV